MAWSLAAPSPGLPLAVQSLAAPSPGLPSAVQSLAAPSPGLPLAVRSLADLFPGFLSLSVSPFLFLTLFLFPALILVRSPLPFPIRFQVLFPLPFPALFLVPVPSQFPVPSRLLLLILSQVRIPVLSLPLFPLILTLPSILPFPLLILFLVPVPSQFPAPSWLLFPPALYLALSAALQQLYFPSPALSPLLLQTLSHFHLFSLSRFLIRSRFHSRSRSHFLTHVPFHTGFPFSLPLLPLPSFPDFHFLCSPENNFLQEKTDFAAVLPEVPLYRPLSSTFYFSYIFRLLDRSSSLTHICFCSAVPVNTSDTRLGSRKSFFFSIRHIFQSFDQDVHAFF